MTDRDPNGGAPDPSTEDRSTADDADDREYTAVRSFDVDQLAGVAVGDAHVALASGTGAVSLLSPDGDRVRVDVEERPRGLAVGSLVYVGLADRVLAFAFDGSRRWNASLDDVAALCWLPESEGLVVATDAGEFVVFDGETGDERIRVDRTHADVSETVILAGHGGGFLAGESWYLTAFDAAGEVRNEAMVDGTITGIGVLGDLAVVSLHGDQVVGVDVDTGETRWTRDLGVDWLAPRGEGSLRAASGGRLVAIGPDGDVTDVSGVSDPDAERVVTTPDDALACRIDDLTVEVLRPRESVSTVDLTVESSSVRAGEAVTVAVANRGGAASGAVRVTGDGGSFAPTSRAVSLAPDERTTLQFTLEDATDSEVTATVAYAASAADDAAVLTRTRETLTVHPSSSGPAVETETREIRNGEATVAVTVRTPDNSELSPVSISPGDASVDPTPGVSSIQRTVSVPLSTDRVTVTPDAGDPVESELSLPEAPLSVTVREADNGFVDVALANDAAVPLEDEVRVSGELLPESVERPISLDAGERLTLAVPAVRAGSGEVRVETAVASTASAVALDRAALAGASGRRRPESGTEPRDPDAGTLDRRDAGTPDRRDTAPSGRTDRRTSDRPGGPRSGGDDQVGAGGDRRDASVEPTGTSADRPETTDRSETADADSSGPTRRSGDERTGPTSPRRSRQSDDSDAATSPSTDEGAVSGSRPTPDDATPDSMPTSEADGPDPLPVSDESDADAESGPASLSDDTDPASPQAVDDVGPDSSSPREASGDRSSDTAPSSGDVAPSSGDTAPSEDAARDPIGIERRLESESANEGHAIEETLTIENRSSRSRSVTVASDGSQTTVEVPADATAEVSRSHAGWGSESIEIPAVTARVDGHEATVPATSVPLESAPVVVRPTLSVQGGSTGIRLDVRNDLDASCSVSALDVRGLSESVAFEGFEVGPGAEAFRETTAQGTPDATPAFSVVRIDRRSRPVRTIAAVRESDASPVSVAVESVDVLGDRDTNVVLRVTNDGGDPLDIRIEATGSAPDEYLYSAGEIDGLAPGASATHRVECTVDSERIELPVEVETIGPDDEEPRSMRVVAAGDRNAEASAWEVGSDDDGIDLDDPATLSTAFDGRSVE